MIQFNREWENSEFFPGDNLFVIRPFIMPPHLSQNEILEVSVWGNLPDSLSSAQEQSFSFMPLSKEDGIYRHAQLLVRDKNSNRYQYSLELLAICHHFGIDKSGINIIDTFWLGKCLELSNAQGVKIRIPIDVQGRALINFVGGINEFSHISFADALDLYQFEKEKFERAFFNKLVLVGITTDEAPRAPTPLGQLNALAMRANAISTLLNQKFISRLSYKADILYMGFLCILATVFSVFFYKAEKNYSWLLFIGLILLIFHTLSTLTMFRFWGIWLDFTRPFLAVVISSVVSSLYLGYLRLQQLFWKLQATQKQLVQSEKEAVYGRMIAQVRHEIRGILNLIRSPAEIVQRNFQKGDPLNMKEQPEIIIQQMGRIITEVGKLNDMVENELGFFKNTNFHFEDNDLSKIIDSSLHAVKNEIQERNIDISVEIDPNLPLLFADGDRLRIAFTNLIKNACQAMPEGGELRIETEYHPGIRNSEFGIPNSVFRKEGLWGISQKVRDKPKAISADKQSEPNKLNLTGDYAVVKFQDTGFGIPEEDKEKIFEPFITTKPRGLGLGLAIVKNVINGHNGQIAVESEVGTGTTFAVAIPIRAKSDE
jgi:signal transduction histidine kinase